MVDNIGSHEYAVDNCVTLDAGITSAGGEGSITIDHVDPLIIDDYILGSDNDYIGISYIGKFPTIKQEAYAGEIVTHEMIEISAENESLNVMINPSPNSDLAILNVGTYTPFDAVTEDSRIIITTKLEERYDNIAKEMQEWMVLYMIADGSAFAIGESMFDDAVLGTARVRIKISFTEDTIVSGFIYGSKDFPIAVHTDIKGIREEEEMETLIGKEARLQESRNTARGFANKMNKIFDTNGGL